MNLRQRLVTAFVAVLLGALSVFAQPGPALADHTISRGHWDRFTWAGTTHHLRYVYVLDRSADSTIKAALQEFSQAFNNDSQRRGMGFNPILTYIDDSANAGSCIQNVWTQFPAHSFITVCSWGSNTGGVTWTSGGHFNNRQPNVFVGKGYPDYNSVFSVVAHELMHAMGSNHSLDCNVANTIMGGFKEAGCKQPAYVKLFLREHDWLTLFNFYAYHPVGQ